MLEAKPGRVTLVRQVFHEQLQPVILPFIACLQVDDLHPVSHHAGAFFKWRFACDADFSAYKKPAAKFVQGRNVCIELGHKLDRLAVKVEFLNRFPGSASLEQEILVRGMGVAVARHQLQIFNRFVYRLDLEAVALDIGIGADKG